MINADSSDHYVGNSGISSAAHSPVRVQNGESSMMRRMKKWLGVDSGGTFTDFVLIEDGRLRVHKVLSTPDAPERAILQGLAEMGLTAQDLRVVHGSTVATNAALEGKGVETVFVTNRGFGDMLTIGRQQRDRLYDLQPPCRQPPVPTSHCLETGGRLDANGEFIEPLTQQDLKELVDQIHRLQPQAVAVNLLFSYLDGGAEQHIGAAMPDDLFVSLSSEVLPEIREYERGMATWLNAWLGPLVEGYIRRLTEGLAGASVAVLQSAGQTVDAAQAAGSAVRMLLSGPAGGLVGARFTGQAANCDALLTFDMGGTSTDVALIDGEPRLTSEGRIGQYPVAVPMVDMHTIGAGGGSIAWLDDGGMLQVGPESAGASPGPVCYGFGGSRVTVTDANLLLGRLLPDAFLGGDMRLDVAVARAAMSELAMAMNTDPVQAARDIIAVANEHMAQALRTISVKRGADPRDFTLMSFGGAGALHVCELAEQLGMVRAIVPVQSGVLSALGMLAARPGRQLSQTWVTPLDSLDDTEVSTRLEELAQQGREALMREGVDAGDCCVEPGMDLRYQGQSYTLNLRWEGVAATSAAFHRLHEARYGHRLDGNVELVTLRQSVSGPESGLKLPQFHLRDGTPRAVGETHVAGIETPVPVYRREELTCDRIEGPAVIIERVATTWLAQGWRCVPDSFGNLLLSRP